ncbi:MAG: SDR family oxidoreductase [Alphaproteobacteria bacterium]|nr:SDR family oxidoreductase [Alphaproteobacteria bacterium]
MVKKTNFENLCDRLKGEPKLWLVTGAAGFIGSNLVESLLRLGQHVVGLDNFATGHRANLEAAVASGGPGAGDRFEFIQGDICIRADCDKALAPRAGRDVGAVLHQAALGSVPRSIADPVATNLANVTGFVTLLTAVKEAGAPRFVYAASSSTYGDSTRLPKVEDVIGQPLSPYALTKYINELYAQIFTRTYGIETVGLRYFNVFGQRQDPNGAYAAVIPKWVSALIRHEDVFINGTGETSRDFCHIDNVVQANLLSAMTTEPDAVNEVYNVAVGGRTSLIDLLAEITGALERHQVRLSGRPPIYRDFRAGDAMHTQADISKAKRLLGFAPTHSLQSGLAEAIEWYIGTV